MFPRQPAYQPKAALQIFREFVEQGNLFGLMDQKPHQQQVKSGAVERMKGGLLVMSMLGMVAMAML